jgi:hypothetical protein
MELQLIIETARSPIRLKKIGELYIKVPLGRKVPAIATEIISAIRVTANFTDVTILRSGFMKCALNETVKFNSNYSMIIA